MSNWDQLHAPISSGRVKHEQKSQEWRSVMNTEILLLPDEMISAQWLDISHCGPPLRARTIMSPELSFVSCNSGQFLWVCLVSAQGSLFVSPAESFIDLGSSTLHCQAYTAVLSEDSSEKY